MPVQVMRSGKRLAALVTTKGFFLGVSPDVDIQLVPVEEPFWALRALVVFDPQMDPLPMVDERRLGAEGGPTL